MRLLSPRGAVAVLATVALLAATPVATATAAARPDRVGLVNVVGASLTASGATLTVDWTDVPGADRYEVFASPSYDKLPTKTTPSVTVTASKATVGRLDPGRDYYIQVRAVNSAGPGLRSLRIGHGTIADEVTLRADTPVYRLLTWNVCSNACGSLSTRTRVITSRIRELAPDIVALQEASKYTTAPTGYRHVVDGQNDILVRRGEFGAVPGTASKPTSGSVRFSSTYATSGKGVAWAALHHRSGAYILVLDVHLVTGTSRSAVAQREYEAGRVASLVTSLRKKLAASHRSVADWTRVPAIFLGDFNTHKSRTDDDTMAVLEGRGYRDAFDQARALTRQHHNTANPEWSTRPVIGQLWGAHVDKVVVRPSRAVVRSWANAGEMSSSSRYVTPLGSDHHPLLVEVSLR